MRLRWHFLFSIIEVQLIYNVVFISGVQQCVIQLYLLICLYIFNLFPQSFKKYIFFKFFFRVYWSEKGLYVMLSETSDMFYILNIKDIQINKRVLESRREECCDNLFTMHSVLWNNHVNVICSSCIINISLIVCQAMPNYR